MIRATLEDMLVAREKNLMHCPGFHSVLTKDWQLDMNSHIVLAACRDYEYAKVKKVNREDGTAVYIGIFTDLFVCALRSSHWRKETTYVDLLDCLDKMSYETLVTAGNHKRVCLWYQE